MHPIILLLDKWPSRKAIADDAGVDLYAVHRWYQRKHIPPKHDACLVASAARRGFSLSWQELIEARAQANNQDGHNIGASQGATQ